MCAHDGLLDDAPLAAFDEVGYYLGVFAFEFAHLFDRLLRKQAEFENYKKRMEREKSEFMQYASSELMKDLLNALDSFDLAIRNATAEGAGR